MRDNILVNTGSIAGGVWITFATDWCNRSGLSGGFSIIVIGHDDKMIGNGVEPFEIPEPVFICSIAKNIDVDRTLGVDGQTGFFETRNKIHKIIPCFRSWFTKIFEIDIKIVKTEIMIGR